MVRFFRASISAGSSMTEPRAMLTTMPVGPSALSTSALIMFFVEAPGIVLVGDAGLRVTRMIDDRHAEGLEPPCDGTADAAHADHADGAVPQGGLRQRIIG